MGIAEQVIGSPATVRTHVEHSYEKHSVGESAAAVARAPNRLDPLQIRRTTDAAPAASGRCSSHHTEG
jgi:hypothetical protein